MNRDVARASLYRGTINLWVEDDLTRSYLEETWKDSSIAYFIGGGSEGAKAIVHDAEEAGYPNVFAVIDRDNRPSNHRLWLAPGKSFRTFVLPVHEIENYLLDSAALVQSRYNQNNMTIDDIELFMKVEGNRRVSCEACRLLVGLLRNHFRGRFLKEPKLPAVSSEEDAFLYICESGWYRSLSRRVESLDRTKIRRLLSLAHDRCRKRLDDGSWRREFAGKELFRAIVGKMYGRAQDAEMLVDLARNIAVRQAAEGSIPKPLQDLLAALKRRISAPSP